MRSEYFGQHFNKRRSVKAVIVISMILSMIGLQATAKENAKIYRSVVHKFVYIPAADAKKQLVELGLGTDISELDNINSLIITTDNLSDRLKVKSILKLIDSELKYEVTRLATAVDPKNIPDTAKINAAIRGIEIGSFMEPPRDNGAAMAIVDIHEQDLIAIAPIGLINPIITGFADLQSDKKTKTKTLTIKKAAEQVTAINATAPSTKENGIFRMTELGATRMTAAKSGAIIESKHETAVKSNFETKGMPDAALTATINDNSSFTATMKDFRDAKLAFSEAFVNADSGSVNEFMGDESRAKQLSMFAKNNSPDSSFLDLINEAREKAKIKRAEDAKKVKAAESTENVKPKIKEKAPATPAKTIEEPKSTPATPARPAKIAEKPKAAPAKEAPQKDDSMAEVMKMIKEMNAEKAKVKSTKKEPVAAEPKKVVPAKAAPVKAAPRSGTRPNVHPMATLPEKTETAAPGKVAKTTSLPKSPSNLSEEELETTINLPTKVQITKLLELVGMQLGLNYMYEPTHVTGEVTLFIHDGGKIKVRELYSLVESVLKFKGLVMTRNGKLITIVRQGDTTSIDPMIILPGEDISEIGNVVVTKVFELKYVDTVTAQKMLTDMKLGISIQSIPDNGTMIITGYAYRMERIQEVLDLIDLPGKKKLFKYRTLEYLTPSELAPKLQVLAKELGTVSITVSAATMAATPAQRTPTPPASNSAAGRAKALAAARARATAAAAAKRGATTSTIGTATSKGVYLDMDDRTNRILMIGLKDTIDVVEGLIDILDVKQQGIKIIRQYKIEFVDASMITDILSELGISDGGARPVSSPSKGPATSRGANSGEGPKISILAKSNSLLINATLEKHDEIMAIIAHVDVENPDERTIKEYAIEFVDPTEILDTLAELGIVSGGSKRSSSNSSSRYGSTTSRTNPNMPTAKKTTTQQSSSSFSEPLADEPQIAILETTSALLVNATAKQHASIAMVISHVDRELAENSTPYVVYQLGNQNPTELKAGLDELVNATMAAKTDAKAGGTTGSAATSKIVSTPRRSGPVDPDDRVTIVADEETRSLVVYASKKNQLWIGNLIAELDAYRSQVLLDVTLVEITKDDSFNFDLNLATKKGGYDGEDFGAGLGSAVTGFGRAFFSDYHIDMVLESMDQKKYGRVLARPSILVKDNEEGEIKTEKKTYIADIKSNVVPGNNGSDPYSSSSVSYTGYTSGITLTITPHIASDDLLQLEITLDRTDFDNEGQKITVGENEVTIPPDELSSSIGTMATLPDGATIILGGIEQVDQNKTVTKVPILGDIPLIGLLFRGVEDKDTQSKLYIFVKANIIKPRDRLTGHSDIERISAMKRNKFRKDEAVFQGLQSIPGIKPNPLDPIHILEDDDEYLKSLKATEPKKYIEIDLNN